MTPTTMSISVTEYPPDETPRVVLTLTVLSRTLTRPASSPTPLYLVVSPVFVGRWSPAAGALRTGADDLRDTRNCRTGRGSGLNRLFHLALRASCILR